MYCPHAHHQLTSLLSSTRQAVQPTCLRFWRCTSEIKVRHTCVCSGSSSAGETFAWALPCQLNTPTQDRIDARLWNAVLQQNQATSFSDVSQSLSRNALDKLFAAEAPPTAICSSRTAHSLCVLGIDPDISGAVAVLQWDLSSSDTQLQLQDAKIVLHDMPITSVVIGKRLQRSAGYP